MADSPTEDALRRAAEACFRNAEMLRDSAQLLESHGRLPHALALASFGIEEFAKGLIFVLAAIRDDERHLLPPKVDGHHLKRFMATHAWAAALPSRQAGDDLTAEVGYPPSAEERLTTWMVELAQSGLAEFVTTSKRAADQAARDYYAERNAMPSPAGAPLLPPTPVGRREAALYVELLPDGTVLEPQRVALYGVVDVGRLRGLLMRYRTLHNLLRDPVESELFVDEVRRRIVR